MFLFSSSFFFSNEFEKNSNALYFSLYESMSDNDYSAQPTAFQRNTEQFECIEACDFIVCTQFTHIHTPIRYARIQPQQSEQMIRGKINIRNCVEFRANSLTFSFGICYASCSACNQSTMRYNRSRTTK